MELIVVDTSVVVKWFCAEEDSEKAKLLLTLRSHQAIELLFPEAIILELINVLHFGKRFTHKDATETIQHVLNLQPKMVPLSQDLIDSTIKTVYTHAIASYDAQFLALAQLANTRLITADYKHHHKSFWNHIIYLSEWDGTVL